MNTNENDAGHGVAGDWYQYAGHGVCFCQQDEYGCTRGKGHNGDHVAGACERDRIFARWPSMQFGSPDAEHANHVPECAIADYMATRKGRLYFRPAVGNTAPDTAFAQKAEPATEIIAGQYYYHPRHGVVRVHWQGVDGSWRATDESGAEWGVLAKDITPHACLDRPEAPPDFDGQKTRYTWEYRRPKDGDLVLSTNAPHFVVLMKDGDSSKVSAKIDSGRRWIVDVCEETPTEIDRLREELAASRHESDVLKRSLGHANERADKAEENLTYAHDAINSLKAKLAKAKKERYEAKVNADMFRQASVYWWNKVNPNAITGNSVDTDILSGIKDTQARLDAFRDIARRFAEWHEAPIGKEKECGWSVAADASKLLDGTPPTPPDESPDLERLANEFAKIVCDVELYEPLRIERISAALLSLVRAAAGGEK
jgi:hypothetical protein